MKKTTHEKNIDNLLKVTTDYGECKKEDLTDYIYIVKANDKFLSGWGGSGPRGHCQLILCKTKEQATLCMEKMRFDDFNYINYFSLNYEKINLNPHKTYNLHIIDHCPLWK